MCPEEISSEISPEPGLQKDPNTCDYLLSQGLVQWVREPCEMYLPHISDNFGTALYFYCNWLWKYRGLTQDNNGQCPVTMVIFQKTIISASKVERILSLYNSWSPRFILNLGLVVNNTSLHSYWRHSEHRAEHDVGTVTMKCHTYEWTKERHCPCPPYSWVTDLKGSRPPSGNNSC